MQLKKNGLFVIILTTLVSLSACSTTEDPIDNAVKTDGTLTVKATTSTYSGEYAPHNVVAIWIESGSGTFVKTLLAKAGVREQYLTN
jgi:hypothetical protein